jgi:hypothetical protein
MQRNDKSQVTITLLKIAIFALVSATIYLGFLLYSKGNYNGGDRGGSTIQNVSSTDLSSVEVAEQIDSTPEISINERFQDVIQDLTTNSLIETPVERVSFNGKSTFLFEKLRFRSLVQVDSCHVEGLGCVRTTIIDKNFYIYQYHSYSAPQDLGSLNNTIIFTGYVDNKFIHDKNFRELVKKVARENIETLTDIGVF